MWTLPLGQILIRTAQGLVIVLSILMFMFIIGDGLPDISEMSPRQTILLVSFIVILTGMNLIWWKRKASAWTILGGSASFWLIQIIYNSGFWVHWFFFIYPFIALLIFLSDKYPSIQIGKKKRKYTKRK